MNKIFLSHSSNDKEYVSYIANQFGKDQCVYDELCFEAGMKNLDEIFKEMNKTSIFVFFISETSLESKWVKKELSIADERLNHDPQKLSQIFPIIIDPLILIYLSLLFYEKLLISQFYPHLFPVYQGQVAHYHQLQILKPVFRVLLHNHTPFPYSFSLY